VVAIKPETNQVVIGDDSDVFTDRLYADNLNFMAVEDITEPIHVMAKIRYSHGGAMCTVKKVDEDKIECVFDEPVRAVTPGQAVVLYDGEYVLGGGVII
jgi:tRNA-specific 2-thiouridylase